MEGPWNSRLTRRIRQTRLGSVHGQDALLKNRTGEFGTKRIAWAGRLAWPIRNSTRSCVILCYTRLASQQSRHGQCPEGTKKKTCLFFGWFTNHESYHTCHHAVA